MLAHDFRVLVLHQSTHNGHVSGRIPISINRASALLRRRKLESLSRSTGGEHAVAATSKASRTVVPNFRSAASAAGRHSSSASASTRKGLSLFSQIRRAPGSRRGESEFPRVSRAAPIYAPRADRQSVGHCVDHCILADTFDGIRDLTRSVEVFNQHVIGVERRQRSHGQASRLVEPTRFSLEQQRAKGGN